MKKTFWNKKEDEIIRKYYPHMLNEEIQALLPHRTTSMIYNRAFFLSVKKTPETIKRKQELCGNLAAEVGKKTQFKKGNVPQNKGKKQKEYMSPEAIEKTKATRFKKGRKPHNTKKEGTINLRFHKRSKKGYLYIKISDGNWELLHRHIWKKHHGEIPKGMNIQFKDGNPQNVDIANLELVSKNENMQRNTIHNWPEDLLEIKRLITRISRRIKKQENNETRI